MYRARMSKEALVAAVKQIVSIAREGNLDGAYQGYSALFSDPGFLEQRPEDQRQALRLMVLAKNLPPKPTPAMIEAHRSALPALTELVSHYHEPSDYEMLGVCHVLLGNEDSAREIFREGLRLEREHNAQSDLCGSLMKRISFL